MTAVREVLERAAAIVAERDTLSPRQAKAKVHAMPWADLLALAADDDMHRARELWRVRSDIAGTFTTPAQRLDAAEELARLLAS